MEKQIVTWSYWLGLISSLIGLGLRTLNFFGILTPGTVLEPGKRQSYALTYWSFYDAALLLFLIAVATASYAWVRGQKT